jgi:hypothetical protein
MSHTQDGRLGNLLAFGVGGLSVLIAALPFGPPYEADAAAAEALTWPWTRVAWSLTALFVAVVLGAVGGMLIRRMIRSRPTIVFFWASAPYLFVLLLDCLADPSGHNLLPIEMAFHAPILLVSAAVSLGSKSATSESSGSEPPPDQEGPRDQTD